MDTLCNYLIDLSECDCNKLITYKMTEIKTLVSVIQQDWPYKADRFIHWYFVKN